MALIREGAIVPDTWQNIADDQELDCTQRAIITLARWQSAGDDLRTTNRALGIRLRGDQHPAAIVADLGRFDLVALEFAKFTDGRAFSHARTLRERYGFTGELRAVGEVLRDQLLFMLRCGFDSFEVADSSAATFAATTPKISVFYQATGDGRVPVRALRNTRA
ncbi:MAG: DUF934 domain-containing protein [Alphaproteobacteria bacterium]|nr:DUF934 domain-containing protein [Alphaproteobacteria bacterium]